MPPGHTQRLRAALVCLGYTALGCATVTQNASRVDASQTESTAVVVDALDDEGGEAGEQDLSGLNAPVPSVAELTPTLWRPDLRITSPNGPGADMPYAIDNVSRLLRFDESQPSCSTRGLLSYGGSGIAFGGAAIVNPSFRERLERFEQVVSDVALATYGRAPIRIHHRGAFACRSQRGQPLVLSEHALGNAIDVSGFDFGPAPLAGERLADAVPATAFRISVARNWQKQGDPIDARHARFLLSLIARLLARGDVFRGIITPKDTAHSDHFHFDMARERYVRL
jgi:hypothetical protein